MPGGAKKRSTKPHASGPHRLGAPPPARFTSKNDQPLRARPAKLRVSRLLAAPHYRNGCAVLLGRAWLRSAAEQLRNVQHIQATANGAFGAILESGAVVTWGNPRAGGDSSQVHEQLRNVQHIQSVADGFAAILESGAVVTWGDPEYGGDSGQVQEQLRNVRHIQASGFGAFAAILGSGAVVTWGDPEYGGDSSQVQEQLRNAQHIQATDSAFAAIIQATHVFESGAVVTWGDPEDGGDSSQVQEQLRNVRHIQATAYAFAAILESGAVVTWGDPEHGGDSSQVQEQLRNVQHIQATRRAFAAILESGAVVTWGDPYFGGDSSETERSNERGVAAQRFAQARGAVKNNIQAAPVLRTDVWRRSVGQPLLREFSGPRPSRATRAHACSSKGARRANSPLRGHAAAWSPKTSSAAPHPGNPSPPQYRCGRGSARRQAPAQGDVHVRRGKRGARVPLQKKQENNDLPL